MCPVINGKSDCKKDKGFPPFDTNNKCGKLL